MVNKSMSILLLACLTLALVAAESGERNQQQQQQQQQRINLEPRVTAARRAINKRAENKDDWRENNIADGPAKSPEPEGETRITIGEPYKSIIQTTARFALAQSKITKHLNIDTAMNMLNEAAHFLSKPLVLIKAIKLVAVVVATITAALFLFPGAHKFADLAWQDPANAFHLDRYLSNGLEARSVIEGLESRTDETLKRVGLHENSCRQKSLCYFGEIVKCSFPHTAETMTKFVSENFSGSNMKENVYARAFISGFVDRNCTGIGVSSPQETRNCLGDFFNSIMSGAETTSSSNHK